MSSNAIAITLARRSSRDRLRQFAAFLFVTLSLTFCASSWAASFTVNTGSTDLGDKNAGDGQCADANGKCSLRAAIEEANALAGGPHSISFSVPVVLVINGGLPTITAPVFITGPATINGSGNGSAQDCLSFSDASSALYPNGANDSKVIGLSIGNCLGDGLTVNGHGYTISGNFIGVDITGLIKTPNGQNGISMSASHVYNNVDTTSLANLFATFPSLPVQASDISTFANNLATKLATLDPNTIVGNVISGNAVDGIYLHSENLGAVIVSSNMIGTDTTGNIAVANGGSGVHLNGNTFGNLIGPNNVISGNANNGILIDSNVVYLPNYIMGNRIGLALVDQTAHIGNGMNGIFTDTSPDGSLTNKNPTGKSLLIGPANVISDNKGVASSSDPDTLSSEAAGVYITGSSNGVSVSGNTIGMAEFPVGTPLASKNYGNAADGIVVTSSGNTIGGSSAGSGNIIAGNARHGILVSTSNNTSTHILGNTIGVHPAFATNLSLGNGFDGIHIDAASSTYVGGSGTTDFNIIAANGRNGVKIRNGGLTNGWANLVQRNQIFANAKGNPAAQPSALPAGVGVGIDLDHVENATDGPHQEFPATYANLDQSAAVICVGLPAEPAPCSGFTAPASAAGTTTFDWTLKTHGPATFRLEFFELNSTDDNAATSMTFLTEQTITTDATGLPVGCSSGRCTANIPANTAGAEVAMTVTDITALLATPGNLGDWKNSLTCFIGDLGVVLSSCTVNDTSEFSNIVSMPLGSNASLNSLSVSSGALTPAFASATLNYSDAVGNAVASITLTPTLADTTASVKINGIGLASGTASTSLPLAVGANTISVVVTAQDGVTVLTYSVTVNRARALSNNASLSGLSISSGALTPSFASATLGYSDAVANAVSSITLTPTLADLNASVKINGSSVASGTASTSLPLGVGANTISVVVTAQDGVTVLTYSVTVNRGTAPITPITSFSGTSATGTGPVTATLSGGGATCSFGSAATVNASTGAPTGIVFPDGLFQFTAIGCSGSITVTVSFPTAFAASEQYWKYGPTSALNLPHWYTLGAANSLTLVGHTATFSIADGGLGDDDLSVNGIIVDQGGPAQPSAVSTGLSPAIAAPAVSIESLILLALAVATLGCQMQRIRRSKDIG